MNITVLSADIQIKLIRIYGKALEEQLDVDTTLYRMLNEIIGSTGSILKASAGSIFTIGTGEKSATLIAGFGYQKQFENIAKVKVINENEVPDHPDREEKLGITGWILSTGMSFLAKSSEELKNHPHWLGICDPEQLADEKLILQSFIGVPLRSIRGEIIGALKCERRKGVGSNPASFSEMDQIVLQIIASVAAKCIHYVDIAREGDKQFNKSFGYNAITSWARDIISEAVSTEGEMDSFLDIIVKLCVNFLRADSCGLSLVDNDEKTLTQRAGIGSQELKVAIRSYSLTFPEEVNQRLSRCEKNMVCSANCPNKSGDVWKSTDAKIGITAWIAKTSRTLYARDYTALHQHCHHHGGYDNLNFESGTICGAFLGMPLQVGGRVIGVIKVENISRIGEFDPREFSEEDRRRFNVLAQDIALSIKLLEEKYKLRFNVIGKATPTIAEILHGGLNIPELVKGVVNKTRELFDARACALFLGEGGWLVQPEWAACGWSSKKPNVRFYSLVREDSISDNPESEDKKVGLTVWIAVKKKKFTAKSNLQLKTHPHHRGTYDIYNFDREKNEKCESFLGVPLLVQNKLIGVLKVETKKKKLEDGRELFTYFSEQDELVFELIANSAAIAIENARLQETQRLFEQIINNPKKLLYYLHQYSSANAYCITPLLNIVNKLQNDMPDIAAFISCYQALMQPEFGIASVHQFTAIIKKNIDYLQSAEEYQNLYALFLKALEVQSLQEIYRFCDENAERFHNAQPANIVHNELYFFTQIIHNTREHLKTGGKNAGKELENVITVAEMSIHSLGHPEQFILGRIFAIWKTIVGNAFYVMLDNPYSAGLPISTDNRHMFFGREDIIEWIANNLKGNVLVLHGEKRMGKSSILHQLKDGVISSELLEHYHYKICPVFVDLLECNFNQTSGFFKLLASLVHTEAQKYLTEDRVAVPELREFTAEPFQTFNDYITKVCNALSSRGIVLLLLLDEFDKLDKMVEEGKLDPGILRHLRGMLMSKRRFTCIIAKLNQMQKMSWEYRELIDIGLHKEVGFLTREDTFSLVEKPLTGKVSFDMQAIEKIYYYTSGQPYLVQSLCQKIVYDMNEKRKSTVINSEDVEASIEKYLLDPNPVFENIWTLCGQQARLALRHLCSLGYLKQSKFSAGEVTGMLNIGVSEAEELMLFLENRKIITRSTHIPSVNEWLYEIKMPLFYRWIIRAR